METPERLSFERLSLASPTTPQSSSSSRLWRPAAQRNVRNQWSKLAACRQRWAEASSSGRSHATALVNAYLNRIYMPTMNLGALSDLPYIREKAARKLFRQQEVHRSNLFVAYRNLVSIVIEMVTISRSMRCYSKGASSSSIAQFSNDPDVSDDAGDGGGVPVYKNWSIPQYELLADELVQMYKLELDIKRRLAVELLSITFEKDRGVSWSNELYPGEFKDLDCCNLDLTVPYQLPVSNGQSFTYTATKVDGESASKVLEVYLTVWLSEVNLHKKRLAEILNSVGWEMQVTLK